MHIEIEEIHLQAALWKSSSSAEGKANEDESNEDLNGSENAVGESVFDCIF